MDWIDKVQGSDSVGLIWVLVVVVIVVAALFLFVRGRRRQEGTKPPPLRTAKPPRPGGPAPDIAQAVATPVHTRPRERSYTELISSRLLLDTVERMGWTRPPAAQAMAIPAIKEGRDVVAIAPEGEGRQATYLLPALERQLNREGLTTVVLVPDEAAVRSVAGTARDLAEDAHLWVGAIAGAPSEKDRRDLRAGFDLLIATPAGMAGLLGDDLVRLDELELLVLDGGERLERVAGDVDRVITASPGKRQTILLAEDDTTGVRTLAGRALRRAEWIDSRAGSDRAQGAGAGTGARAGDAAGHAAGAAGHGAGAAAAGAGAAAAGAAAAGERLRGTVRWFNNAKGFGFIAPEDGEKDVFVHYSAILDDGFKSLDEGDAVEFTRVDAPKGPEATDVVKL